MKTAVDKQDHKEAAGSRRSEVQLASFRVSEQIYGLDIQRIREIIRPQKITPVPKAPAYIEGVINLRGAIIPLLDLRRRFDLPVPEDDRRTRVMICVVQGRVLALQVDEVLDVMRYSRNEVLPAPHFLKGREAEFFLGVCRREEDLLMIIDLEKILSTDAPIPVESMAAAQASLEPPFD